MASVGTPSLTLAAGVIAAVLALAACGGGAARSPTVAPTSSLVPPLTGQTDTDWGRIWDTLPADFPLYPGATVSDEAATGPASATLVVDGDAADDIDSWTSEQLSGAGYDIESGAALEDGSHILEAESATGCRVQVTATPLGSLTTITILYGASCPNP